MSLKIEEYLSSIGALTTSTTQSTATVQDTAKTTASDHDSYISSVADSTAALPSDNYNDILKIMQSAKSEASGTSTSSEEAVSKTASGGSGGGGGSEEEETTTEVVTIDGVTYLETTTTTDGVTTVTRTVLSSQVSSEAVKTDNVDNKTAVKLD